MGAIVKRTRYDEGTESAEVATSDAAMYGSDLRQNYNMLLSMGGTYRNYGKLTYAVCPIKILDY